MTSTVATPRNSLPRRPSIVTHPWFPKVIGLWFAALFGLCSLAVASDVLERVVTTLGVDQIVPAAAPPLGQTARLLLAMAMAGVGEILGLMIGGGLAARHRARSQRGVENVERGDAGRDSVPQVRGRDRHADAPPRKPLSAVDDLGGNDRSLRGALISETDHEPRPSFEGAPLPGADPSFPATIENLRAPPNPPHTPPFSDPATHEILELGTCGAQIGQEEVLEARPFAAPEDAFVDDATPAHIVTVACDSIVAEPVASPQPAPVVDIAAAALDTLGVVHLSERLALALEARRKRRSRPMPDATVVAPDSSLAPVATSQPAGPPRLPGLYPTLADESEGASPDVANGHDILVRRAPKANAEITPVEQMADSPVALETDEVADDDTDPSAAGYSSLLAMGTSFARPEPVRIDEPQSAEIEPVVIFPGHDVRPANPFAAPGTAPFAAHFGQPGAVAAPERAVPAARTPTTGTMPPVDPEETDRALRAALASLQRISGAR